MTLVSLAAKNLMRNRVRTALTIGGIAVSVLTFMLLRTVVWAHQIGVNFAAQDRVVSRHKVTFVMSLPRRYVDEVRALPGMKEVTWASWWGGKNPAREEEFFFTLAVDPESYLQVLDEISVPADQAAAWKADRQGALIGDALAEKFGWKVGDTVNLQSTIFPGDYTFHIQAIYKATRQSIDRSQFLFHWNYFNDSLPEDGPRDEVGWIQARVTGNTAEMAKKIDQLFDSKDVQTLSQDEGAFQASFLGMFGAVFRTMDIVSAVILAIFGLILGNTISMAVRERTQEHGVLRAIGFLPKHLVLLVVSESAVLGLTGALLGLLLSYPIVELGIGGFIEANMGSMFPYFRIGAGNAAMAVVLSVLVASGAGVLPALTVWRLKVTDALRRTA